MNPELIADCECPLAESPLWHPDEQRVYWVDIPTGRLFRYDPNADTHKTVYETVDGTALGAITIQTDGSLLLFEAAGRIRIFRDGTAETVISIEAEGDDRRFNDVIADPEGRVFAGTTPNDPPGDPPSGRLYRIDTDGTATKLRGELNLPNGMGFARNQEQLYLTESFALTIHQYDYDRVSGELSNGSVFVGPDDHNPGGGPDGLTVDTDGFVWSARFGTGTLFRYTHDGTVDRQITVGSPRVTSLTFGGQNRSEVYVTSGDAEDTEDATNTAGGLYRVTPGVTGRSEYRSRIML